MRDAGLPEPEMHYDVVDGKNHVAEVDFAYPAKRIAIQGDSFEHHSGKRAWLKDSHQRAELASLDWLVLPVTWGDLEERPDEVVSQISRALEARKGRRPRG
jgi:very-short-patch-repair endonuclease